MNNAPCYECNERSPTCHSHCEKYSEYVKKNKEVQEKLKPQRDYIGYKLETRNRLVRK